MWLLYNLLITLAAPLWLPWMLWRTWRREKQPNWSERIGRYRGFVNPPSRPRIWFHAVSVGEFIAAKPILRELRALRPQYELVVSVTTSSGHQTAQKHQGSLFDTLVYFPIDIPRFQFEAMQRVKPEVVVIMETELWMNFLWAAKAVKAKTMLVNGRISDRSFPRSMKIRPFYKALLRFMDECLMQTEIDAQRIQAIGATKATVLGNCKFDQAVEGLSSKPQEWRNILNVPSGAPVLVVGSTRGAEEERIVIEAIGKLGMSDLWVVFAPRHLESATGLAEMLQAAFGTAARRSKGETGQYLVLDSYGELAEIYAIADIVIIGGGFEKLGGQNIVQPLAHGKPVLHGPHMANFRESSQMADRAGAAFECDGADAIAERLKELLDNPQLRRQCGEAAASLVRANVGASRRYAEAIAAATSAKPKKIKR